MWSRLFFWLVIAFFITMNVLLWRSEFRGHNNLSHVPVETVWRKILIAPDNSRLEIRQHGKKIGYGTWTPSVGEELATGKRMLEEPPPEGMIPDPSGYSIDFGGNFSQDNSRFRFEFDLRLTTNHQWQQLSLRLSSRPANARNDQVEKPAPSRQLLEWLFNPPDEWLDKLMLFSKIELMASAAAGTMRLSGDHPAGHSEQVIKLADLQDPEKLFKSAGLPFSPVLIAALGLRGNKEQINPAMLGLAWEARNDWLQVASQRMRIYRLEAQLLGFQAVLFISLEGEILRVELPDEIVLVNDQL